MRRALTSEQLQEHREIAEQVPAVESGHGQPLNAESCGGHFFHLHASGGAYEENLAGRVAAFKLGGYG